MVAGGCEQVVMTDEDGTARLRVEYVGDLDVEESKRIGYKHVSSLETRAHTIGYTFSFILFFFLFFSFLSKMDKWGPAGNLRLALCYCKLRRL